MARQHGSQELPPCYAMVIPGLEKVAAEEITQVCHGEVKRTGPGLVVFRVPAIDPSLLRLRTTEDLFLLAWGTEQLSYRAVDLDSIRRWTARDADWERLLRLHHAVRPKPKGKPTFRLVVQMTGTHGYRRVDARKALARGLEGKIPASWPHVEENAALEIWLTIHQATAVCGVRLSDRHMRHRSYKRVHLPASLRPTLAAAMVRLAQLKPGQVLLDPMCGAGTILAEALPVLRGAQGLLLGGDAEAAALRAAEANLGFAAHTWLLRWDARQLPLADAVADRLISNLPFGKQIAREEDIAALYRDLVPEFDRVLRPGGLAVLLVADAVALQEAVRRVPWKPLPALRLRVLGQPATIFVFRKKP